MGFSSFSFLPGFHPSYRASGSYPGGFASRWTCSPFLVVPPDEVRAGKAARPSQLIRVFDGRESRETMSCVMGPTERRLMSTPSPLALPCPSLRSIVLGNLGALESPLLRGRVSTCR